jgi:hypothetical protein
MQQFLINSFYVTLSSPAKVTKDALPYAALGPAPEPIVER